MCASFDGGGGGTAGFHPEIMPASLEKMKTAGPLAPSFDTTKPLGVPPGPLLLKTMPVGAPPGMETTNDGITSKSALYSVDVSLPLLAIHHGDDELAASPHALTTLAS